MFGTTGSYSNGYYDSNLDMSSRRCRCPCLQLDGRTFRQFFAECPPGDKPATWKVYKSNLDDGSSSRGPSNPYRASCTAQEKRSTKSIFAIRNDTSKTNTNKKLKHIHWL